MGNFIPAMAATSDEFPAAAKPSFLQPIKPRVVSTPMTLTFFNLDAGHFAVLDYVDAARVCRPRIAPSHRIMAHRSATRL